MTATLDERLVRHDLGFLQVRHPPTAAELRDYYHNRYFQTDRGNYRRHYADDEVQWFRSQTARTVAAALEVSPMHPRRALDLRRRLMELRLVGFRGNSWRVRCVWFRRR